MADDLYCFDASSIIRLKQDFPRKVFPSVWEKVEELIRADRLIAPDEVFREVEKDDVLGPWAKRHKKMFMRPEQQQIDAARDVASRFPSLAKPGRFGPAADPFVVGLAHLQTQKQAGSLYESERKCVVVTEERGPVSIPGACRHYNLTCVSLVQLFEREGWVFH
jgi:Domain of unknown function (DUF4411)